MKKIFFYIVENSQDNPVKIFGTTNKNSLLSSEKDKFFFNSKYDEVEEIKVTHKYVSFNKKTYDDLVIILENAKEQAKYLGDEPIGEEILKNGSHAIIYSSVYKASHKTPQSIFAFCSEMFVYLLMGHKLNNGNKRVSLLFLRGILRYFGYHFSWTAGLKTEHIHHKIELEKIVEELEKNYNDNGTINISKWVEKNSVIALEWRN